MKTGNLLTTTISCLFLIGSVQTENAVKSGKKTKSSKTGEAVVFIEIANQDFVENDLQSIGDRILWSKEDIFDSSGETVIGFTSGGCTVHSFTPFSVFCNYHVVFTAGDWTDSTLTFLGECPDYGEPCFFTLTGGSGVFAGRPGVVNTQQPSGPDVLQKYTHVVTFEGQFFY